MKTNTNTTTKASAPETRTVPTERPTAIKINQPYVEQGEHSPLPGRMIVEDDKLKPYIVVEYANGMRQQVKRVDDYGCATLEQYAIKLAETFNHAQALAEALRGLMSNDFANGAIGKRDAYRAKALNALTDWSHAVRKEAQ